jgi:N-acetyl-gamma-glutamyl-phosphate reductase
LPFACGNREFETHQDLLMNHSLVPVAILGGSGYTALELIKIFLRHPRVKIEAITSRQEGTPHLSEVHPSLTQRLDLRLENFDPDFLLKRGVQCAFGCLPHGTSSELLSQLVSRGIRVVDLSADYRLRDPKVYQQWYGEAHHDLSNLREAIYGLPEIYGDRINEAKLIANPGCYPQTAILSLAPLLASKLIDPKSIIVDSKSGVSGAGRSPKLTTHFPECNEAVSAYNVGKHRHTPEIEQALSDVSGENVEVIFTPHLIPMDRGILSTIYATPLQAVTEKELFQRFRDYYAKAPFVRVRESLPSTKDVVGTNFLDITLKLVRNRIVLVSVIDNIIRGASGVAVQNFNRMFGFPETMGLL